MISIYIAGRKILTPKDLSFEYVSENRLFSNSDGFSMEIEIPIKGCTHNKRVFGEICRPDIVPGNLNFEAEIMDSKIHLFGSATITEINDVSIKLQFLEGRSAQNFDESFNDVYINRLNLGYDNYSTVDISPEVAFKHGKNAVAIPWVNGDGELENKFEDFGEATWVEGLKYISYMPYLLVIAKRICAEIGFSCDFHDWENSPQKYLLICNVLPASWQIRNYSRALPPWTVREFFDKLEWIIQGQFTFDLKLKVVSFKKFENLFDVTTPFVVNKVLDEFTKVVTADEKTADYYANRNIAFKPWDDEEQWKFECCDWYVKDCSPVVYDTLDEVKAVANKYNIVKSYHRGQLYDKVLYAKDVNCYFIMRRWDKQKVSFEGVNMDGVTQIIATFMNLVPINRFGNYICDDSDDADTEQLDISPVSFKMVELDVYNRRYFPVIDIKDQKDETVEIDGGQYITDVDQPLGLNMPERDILYGQGALNSYFDRLHLGYYTEENGWFSSQVYNLLPSIANVMVKDQSNVYKSEYSLRLNDGYKGASSVVKRIDPRIKYRFSFLSKTLPKATSVFYIGGVRYACEKLTAKFTNDGMSDLIKGEFYRILDD